MTLRPMAFDTFWPWRRAASTGDDLVDRLRLGEAAAVGEAYDLHHTAVRAFARRLTADPSAAEDLVQDVFIALPKTAKRFDGTSSLRTFLIGIAVNHARHHVRAAVRRRQAWTRAAAERSGPVDGPESQVADKELAHALAKALDTLPVDQRVAFVLCEVEERTAGEAAAIVGIPEATVRTRVFHARRKLRILLQEGGFR